MPPVKEGSWWQQRWLGHGGRRGEEAAVGRDATMAGGLRRRPPHGLRRGARVGRGFVEEERVGGVGGRETGGAGEIFAILSSGLR